MTVSNFDSPQGPVQHVSGVTARGEEGLTIPDYDGFQSHRSPVGDVPLDVAHEFGISPPFYDVVQSDVVEER